MKFRALLSTEDGRLTKGKIYFGGFVVTSSLRIVIRDDKYEWMTFNPNVFAPVEN